MRGAPKENRLVRSARQQALSMQCHHVAVHRRPHSHLQSRVRRPRIKVPSCTLTRLPGLLPRLEPIVPRRKHIFSFTSQLSRPRPTHRGRSPPLAYRGRSERVPFSAVSRPHFWRADPPRGPRWRRRLTSTSWVSRCSTKRRTQK